MTSLKDRLTRRTGPSLVIATAGVGPHMRLSAARLRRSGGSERVELFFAFDDALSAVALIGLDRVVSDRSVNLIATPVVNRGIEGDPAVEWKRSYAVVDAARLAARDGIMFARATPMRPQETRYLAEWVSAREPEPRVTDFAVAAARKLWVDGTPASESEVFARLWEEHTGTAPPGPATERVAVNEARMVGKDLYDTPVAVVRGQWFFAHERLDRIAGTLDELGWSRA